MLEFQRLCMVKFFQSFYNENMNYHKNMILHLMYFFAHQVARK